MSKHYFDNTDEIDITDMVEIHQFLDSFFMSRIGIRMLIGQHLEIQKEGANVDNHVVSRETKGNFESLTGFRV